MNKTRIKKGFNWGVPFLALLVFFLLLYGSYSCALGAALGKGAVKTVVRKADLPRAIASELAAFVNDVMADAKPAGSAGFRYDENTIFTEYGLNEKDVRNWLIDAAGGYMASAAKGTSAGIMAEEIAPLFDGVRQYYADRLFTEVTDQALINTLNNKLQPEKIAVKEHEGLVNPWLGIGALVLGAAIAGWCIYLGRHNFLLTGIFMFLPFLNLSLIWGSIGSGFRVAQKATWIGGKLFGIVKTGSILENIPVVLRNLTGSLTAADSILHAYFSKLAGICGWYSIPFGIAAVLCIVLCIAYILDRNHVKRTAARRSVPVEEPEDLWA